jgi:hypothetical protein
MDLIVEAGVADPPTWSIFLGLAARRRGYQDIMVISLA